MTFYGRIGMGEFPEDDDDSPSAERERLSRIKIKLDCDPDFRESLRPPKKSRKKKAEKADQTAGAPASNTEESITMTDTFRSITEAIERLPSGSAYWRHVRARLTRLARRGPSAFWPAYLAVIDAQQHDDPVRQFAQEAVRSGVTSETSLAELVEERLAVPKQ